MSKIANIGMLDVREIKEEVAKEITAIENIGLILESDESQSLLKHVKKQNIGSSIKIPLDKNIKLISNNGSMKIDKDYLEGIDGTLAILINGDLRFTDDVTNQLINEKIHIILINGKLICPKNISGTILSKATINGITISHKSGYIFFPGVTELSNRFLKGFREKAKLSFEKLILGDDLDTELLNAKIDCIEVVEKLIALEKDEDRIYPYIDEYYAVEKEIIPSEAKGIKYMKDGIGLGDKDIESYDGIALYVDGDVEISVNEEIDIKSHIRYILCNKLMLKENLYPKMKDIIGTDVKVEIINGKLLMNKGKMYISENFKEIVTIRNMGKLVFQEDVDVENIERYVHGIDNFGVIEAPSKLVGVLNNKANKNYGKIREPLSKDEEVKKQDKDLMYGNIGELKL